MSISNHAEDALLNAIGGTSYAASGTYLKLHTGDPSETGTANAADEKDLVAISFSAASGGSMGSSSTATWVDVAAAETYTHWSLWDANTVDGSNEPSGNCLWTGALSGSATVAAGDTFQITSLTLTLD